MKLKWILFIITIASMVILVLNHSQNYDNLLASNLNSQIKIQKAAPDSVQGLAPVYNRNDLNGKGWLQRPGQMPVFIPDSTLTDAMPIYSAPNVDSKMIIPMNTHPADTTKVPKNP